MQIESEGVHEEGNQYVTKTDAEILTIAKGVYRNEIFTSMQIQARDQGLLIQIFLPLLFIDSIMRKEMIRDKITHFYAYMNTAMPQAINGYPMFSEMAFLSTEDAQRVINKLKEIEELLGDN